MTRLFERKKMSSFLSGVITNLEPHKYLFKKKLDLDQDTICTNVFIEIAIQSSKISNM